MASPASDSDNGVRNEFEGSDDEGTFTGITRAVSKSDEGYWLESDPDFSSSELSEVDESNMAAEAMPVK